MNVWANSAKVGSSSLGYCGSPRRRRSIFARATCSAAIFASTALSSSALSARGPRRRCVQLAGALLYRGAFFVRESLGDFVGGALGGLHFRRPIEGRAGP